jgi:4-amino-4-deoxy-L-arabinose transferase-like glycosyltransferase
MILLSRKKYLISGILLALAFAVKQSIWPFIPLYVAYIYFVSDNLRRTTIRLSSFFVTFAILVIPFFLWNPGAFLDSTVFYLSGNTAHSYPISGYGLGMLLHQLGFIKDLNSSYPFVLWQVLFVVPVLVILLGFLRKYPKVKILILSYGLLVFVYWYMSRYFNNSHVGYLTMVFLTAYFWPDESEGK